MFCSTECFDESMRRYHRYECPVIDQLLKSWSVHMALRLLFIALSTFNGSIGGWSSKISSSEQMLIAQRSLTAAHKKLSLIKKLLQCLTSLMRSQKVFALHQHEEILRNHPTLKALWSDHREFIKSFLLRLCQISDLNFHGIFSGSSQNPSTIFSSLQQTRPLDAARCFSRRWSITVARIICCGCAWKAKLCSLFVVRSRKDLNCSIVTSELIVFQKIWSSRLWIISNRSNFMVHPKVDRQAMLYKEFGFSCDCEACSQNFPTPPALQFKDIKLMKHAKKSDDEILSLPSGQVSKKLRDCCELLEKNHRNFSSIELCLLQKCIATCFLRQA